jgi:Ras GTPase-activating-like protein IQGAP2/3
VESQIICSFSGRKRFALPFTKQFNHMRDLQRAGKIPQFGSFIYSARLWYDKGILLSLDKHSPLQYDKMDVVLSSNSVGVFTVEIRNHAMGINNRIAMADVKMEDLLQAQYDDHASLSLFDGMAKFNLKLLLYQINKK